MTAPALGEPLVVGSGVAIEYDGFRAVDAADFVVRRGEKFVLIGPSGCGKTTLLKAIAGFLTPSQGSITLDGVPIGEPGPDRTVVFQDFDQLFAWRTVLDNVVYALDVAKGVRGEAARERARAMLRLVGIEAAGDKYPHQLSGGMKQRGAIARALALEPRILLMDEPFGALDVQTRELLQEEMLRIIDAEAKTVVFVTHSIEEAIYLADRIVVLSARPAGIVMDVRVPFARPRDESIKAHPDFVHIRWEIWSKLKSDAKAS